MPRSTRPDPTGSSIIGDSWENRFASIVTEFTTHVLETIGTRHASCCVRPIYNQWLHSPVIRQSWPTGPSGTWSSPIDSGVDKGAQMAQPPSSPPILQTRHKHTFKLHKFCQFSQFILGESQ